MKMEYRSFVSLNIAIIGNTRLAEVLAAAYVEAGHTIFLAAPPSAPATACEALDGLDRLYRCSVEDAAASADFIVICTRANDVREVAYWLGDIRRKVIIDLTANVPEGLKDNMNTVGAIKAITGSDHIVKALSLYAHEHLFSPLFGGKKVQVVLAGDSRKAKEIMKIIGRELGVEHFHDFGGAETLPLFDELCRCCRSMMKINYEQAKVSREASSNHE